MTAKCGQKCTAIRRAIVPADLLEDVQIALGKALSQTTIGHPRAEGVRMGALAGRDQAGRLARAGGAPAGLHYPHRVRRTSRT
ncbi:MAG: aldehyde dehydrogenase family protein [Hymenobacter sp.]